MSEDESIKKDKIVEEYKKLSKKLFLSFPAYQFFVNYIEMMNEAGEQFGFSSEYSEIVTDFLSKMYLKMMRATSQDINKELRLIEIENDLIPLLESTDNKIFYRPLFFPTIFINNEFEFETFIVKGITVVDVPSMKDLLIYTMVMEQETSTIMICFSSILTKFNIFSTAVGDFEKDVDKLFNYILILVCNIIDMIEGNDEDLEVTTIISTPEQNKKRIKRGKIPLPTKVFIRTKKEFRQYIKYFNNYHRENTKINFKFLVRGHWRHFRSERYVRKKGEKAWIKPFYKGEGIVIAKPYKLTK